MMMSDDGQLLEAFVRTRSAEAFGALVARHVDMVYAAARRQAGNANDAEDVTQAVFIVLAQKAGAVGGGGQLAGWLLKVTHFAAGRIRRAAARRRKHEQEGGAMLPTTSLPPDPEWDKLSPHLDAALARLSTTDRAAVVAHCIQEKSMAEIAADLGVSEPATRKRVQRALERLRAILGPKAGMPCLALAGLMASHAVAPAPPALAATVSTTALAVLHGTVVASTAITLAKGVTHMMFLAKAKLAAIASLALIIVTTITGTAVHYARAQPVKVAATTNESTTSASVAGKVIYRGVLVDPAGKAVPNAAVRVYVSGDIRDNLEWEGKTAADGTFVTAPMAEVDDYSQSHHVMLFDAPGLAFAWAAIGMFDDPAAIRVTVGRPTEVAGTLTNARGEPVANAVVEASVSSKGDGHFNFNRETGLAVTSDGQGRFRFGRIPENTSLQLTVRHSDYQTWSTQFRGGDTSSVFPVTAGTADADMQLEDRPAAIRAQLMHGGKPLAKAGITFLALNRTKGAMEIAQSNMNGRAEFTGLSPGTWIVRTPGSQEYVQALIMPVASLALSAGESRDVSAEMGTTAVRGTVFEGDSTLPARETAYVSTTDPKLYVAAARPDANGRFELLLPPGRYRLNCSSWEDGKYRMVEQGFAVVAEAAVLDLVVRVHSQPVLRGQLVDSSGHPLSGLVVLGDGTHALAGVDGQFSMAVPQPRSQMTGVAVDSRRTLARSFVAQPPKSGDRELRLMLEPMGTITGRALDRAGRALPDTRVDLSMPDASGMSVGLDHWIWRTTMEEDGTFLVTNVPTGNPLQVYLQNRQEFAATEVRLMAGETQDLGEVVLHGPVGTTQQTFDAARNLRPNPALVLPPREVWDATIAGRVLDTSGKPVVGMEFSVRMTAENRATVSFEDNGVSDLKGRFKMGGFPHNRSVHVTGNSHDGGGWYAWDITPGAAPVELRLSPEAKVAATQP